MSHTNPSASLETIIIDLAFEVEHAFNNQPKIDKAMDKATQALHSAILSRMPEKYKLKHRAMDSAVDWGHDVGYNAALTDITQVLNDFFEGSK